MDASDTITAFKCIRPDGTDFRTGKVRYEIGTFVAVADAAPPEAGQCAPGLHVSPTPLLACRASRGIDGSHNRPWRFIEVAIEAGDIIYRETDDKWRVRRLWVHRELTQEEVFGSSLSARAKALRTEAASWKQIPWLKPARPVIDAEVIALVDTWRERVTPYLPAGRSLPSAVRLVRTREEATTADAAAADAAAADAAADAAAAAADAAAADAAADAAAADAAAAAAADAAADAATAADAAAFNHYWWYTRPYYTLRRHGRWMLGGLPVDANPYAPLVALFKLGCVPIGYSDGAFVVYVPGAAS